MKKENLNDSLARIFVGYFLVLIPCLVVGSYESVTDGHLRLGNISRSIVLWALYGFFLPEISLDKTMHKKFFRRLRLLCFPVFMFVIFISGVIEGVYWLTMIVLTSVAFTALLPFLFNVQKRKLLFRGVFFLLAVFVFCAGMIFLPVKTTAQRFNEQDLSLRRLSKINIINDWETMPSDLEILDGSKNVSKFYFEGVQVRDRNFDLLATLSYLKSIKFKDCQITGKDLAKLTELQHLKELILQDVVVDGNLDSITELHHLKKLSLITIICQVNDLLDISNMQNI